MAAVGPDLPPSLKTASAGCRASRVTHLVFGCGRGNHRHRASSCELRWREPPSERTSLSWRRYVEIAAWAGSSDTNPFSLRRSTSRFYVALPGRICIRLMRLAASPRFSWRRVNARSWSVRMVPDSHTRHRPAISTVFLAQLTATFRDVIGRPLVSASNTSSSTRCGVVWARRHAQRLRLTATCLGTANPAGRYRGCARVLLGNKVFAVDGEIRRR